MIEIDRASFEAEVRAAGEALSPVPDGRLEFIDEIAGQSPGYVSALKSQPDGARWAATQTGLARLSNGAWTVFTVPDRFPSGAVRAISASPDGALWFAVRGGGVGRLYENSWTIFTEQDGLADNDVWTGDVGPDGTVWFGTGGGSGLVSRFGDDKWQTLGADLNAGGYVWSVAGGELGTA